MRLGLIGADMHWHTYVPALTNVPDLTLAAVAPAGAEETHGIFDGAPGVSAETRRYEDAREMLEREALDVVQVCGRPHRNAAWTIACLERGFPVVCEKPLAMDMPELESVYRAAEKSRAPLVPMHTQREDGILAAAAHAVRAGEIGEPLVGFSQKSYKWGATRPDYYKSRETFPGLAPFIGIHAFDWLYWMLGDVFTAVEGYESAAARP
jgi:predicted dehydrogenase